MLDRSLLEAMEVSAALVQKRMRLLLPDSFNESRLVDAMLYSSMSAGKRIRPFLTIVCAQMFGVSAEKALNAAAAIEFIHTYSLIHDDLPAMDNDDLRRGKPTCHKKFDEATAILAGDALLTYAFEILADANTHTDPFVRCELVKTAAQASGFRGMVGGQMIDLETANQKITKEQIAKLHRLKTGELFMAACEMGAILGHGKEADRHALRYYSHDLGLAFQIKDDILDHEGTNIGKMNLDEIMHSKAEDNASIVDVIGLENAIQQLDLLKSQAVAHLSTFGDRAKLLVELSEFIVSRQK